MKNERETQSYPAGTGRRSCALPEMRMPNPSPVLIKMDPEILSNTGAGGPEEGSCGIARLLDYV